MIIDKNGKEHNTGDKNERQVTCAHCGKKLQKGNGYKIVNSSTYVFVCPTERNEYIANLVKTESSYINDFTFKVKVWSKLESIDYLSLNAWERKGNYATLTTKTRNTIKILDSIDTSRCIVDIIGNGKTEKLIFDKIPSDCILGMIEKTARKMGIYDYSNK